MWLFVNVRINENTQKVKKKLVLHICCAPCSIYIFRELKKDYHISGFFYNPNIQPLKEYNFRQKELRRIANQFSWHIDFGKYDFERWFTATKKYKNEPERGKRCSICFHLRLKETFEFARRHQYDIVASTLSISPYKITKQINESGNQLGEEFGIEFLAENFKSNNRFNITRNLANKLAIKHQNYCGCVYSLVEKKLRQRRSS